MEDKYKICKNCKQSLLETSDNFHKTQKYKNKQYFHSICRKCRSTIEPDNVIFAENKKCKLCKIEFPATLENFHRDKRCKDMLRSACKKCKSLQKKIYREKNKEKINQQNREYLSRENVKKHRKERFKSIEYKKKLNEQIRQKRNTDPIFKLKQTIRNSFLRYVKYKNESFFKYLGIPVQEFKKYLESMFLPGMDWDNHGKYGWHVDHIKPLASFDFNKYINDKEKLEELLYEAWNYKNLQPLWAKDNLKKGSKCK